MKTKRTTQSSKKGHSGRLFWRPLSLFSILVFSVLTAVPSLMASSGDFSIDFVAAAPESYNHLIGGGAYDDRTVGVDKDIVESLEGGDFACGDIVTYFAAVTVDNTQTAIDDGPQTIEMDFSFLMDTTGQSGVAIGDIVNVSVNYGTIEDFSTGENTVDDGIVDDGGSVATLIDEYTTGPLFTAGSELWGTVELTDLEASEQVVVRIDVKLFCDPGSNPTGNLQADLQAARLTFINDTTPVDPPQAIPGGAQTIPFKQFGNIQTPELAIAKTVTTADGTCPGLETLTITAGDTVKYCYVVSNPGTAPLYNVALTDDNGTPGDPGDDFPVPLVGLTDLDNDGSADDLAAGGSATGEALVTLAIAGTVVNTGTATGVDSILFPTEYTASDTATVIVEPPPVEAPQTRVVKGNAEGNDTVATLSEPGGSVTIDVVVYNDAPTPTGDATLTSLVDDIYGDITTTGHDGITATSCATGGVILGGGSYSCSFTVDITSEPGTITDTVTATLTNDAAAVSDDDQANVVINDVTPTVTLVKSANPATLPEPGGDFLFTLDITNTSAETVTIADLTDTQSAATDFSACSALIGTTLAPGASTSCQYTVNHGDVGSYDNTASVTVEDNDGSTASDSDSETVTVTDVLPTVDLTKEATPLSLDEPGGDFLFTLTIANTSVEEITITALSDSQSAEAVDFSACSSLIGTTLAAGASTSCQYTVNHTAPGSYDNTASVTVADNEGNTASDSDSATVVVNDIPSAISMVKTAVPTQVTEPGGDVTYTFTVSNDSAVDSVTIDRLMDTVYGDLDGQGTCSVPQTLAPGGSYTCSFTIFVSNSETNVATASGVDDDGNPVSANDDASVTVNDSYTNIVVTKTATPTSVNEPGDDVTFTVLIDNPSTVDSVTINSLVDNVHGDLNGQGDCSMPQTIAVGGSYTCSFPASVSGNAGDSETDTVTASGVDEDGVPVSDDDSATVTIEDVQPTISVDKTAEPTSVDEPGGEVTFTVVVNNTSVGSDPVTITSLTDDVHGDLNEQGDCAVPQTIAAGSSYTCSFTATVSGNAGDSETDVVTASGTDDEGNTVSASDDATVTVNDVPSSILTTKTASPTTVPETGGYVTFTITVQNTSAVDDVTINSVVDSEFGDVSASCAPALPATLAPGESLTCTFTEFISGDYPNSHTNVATATGQDDDGNPVEDDDQEDVPFEDVLPDIMVVKSASPSSVPETGGDVTFTFVATNNSLEAVTLDSMVDNTFGDLNTQGSCTLPQALGPAGDESASYTCFVTVFLTADNLAPHTNVVTATASDDDGNTDTDTDDETVTFTDVAPQIELIKSASPTSVPETGGDVTFTFTVNNIGQEDVTLTSLTDTVFSDLNGQGDCSVPQTILIGDSYSCSITVNLSADDLAPHTNVATATAVDDDNTEDSDEDDETVTFDDVLPDVSITKTAVPTSVPETGGNVEFTIVVTNNSLEDATIDSLVDSDFDLTAHCPDAVGTVLAYNESYTCVFTEHLTGDDLVAHENTATVVATDNDGNSDEASDDEMVTFTDVAPQIDLTKSASPSSVPETGGDVTFTFLVENIGQEDVTLTSLTDTVFGDLNGQGDCATGGLIPIGGSYSCSITVFLSADDLADHYNVATAVGTDDDGTSDDDSDEETVTFTDVAPQIDLTKSASPGSVPETGGDVTFTFTVDNIGEEDVTLTSLTDTVFGDLNGQGDCATGGLILIGGSYSCSITVFLAADDLAPHTNVATATAVDDDGTQAEDSDNETVTFTDVAPQIELIKSASPSSVPETGGDVTFTFTVNNIGQEDVTLTSLTDTVFSDLNGLGDCAVPQTILIGDSYSCSTTAFLSADDLVSHYNVSTATAVDDDGTQAEDSDDETVTFEDVLPDITVTKTADLLQVPETGGDVTFTFVVTNNNSEEVTISQLSDSVFGPLTGDADCQVGTVLAGNGGTCSFEATFTLSADDLANHVNVFIGEACDDDNNCDTDDEDETVTFEDVLPDVSISKTANPTSVPETGGDVQFTIVVTNNSLEDATIDSLVDSDFDLAVPCPDAVGTVLATGESYTCVFTEFISGDYSGLAHENTATVEASDNDGNTDTESDDETVTFTDVLPDVSITKTANPTSVYEPGDDVEFTIVITNNSLEDATIDSLVDSDFDLAANCPDAVGTVLASGASYTCVFTEFVTGNVGQDHQNTATVVASDNDGNSDTESDSADVTIENVAPVVSIVKDGEAVIAEGGDTATYSFTITNNSVSTDPLTITSLTDDQFGDLLPEGEAANGGPIALNPGGSFSFSIDRDLTLDAGETHTNVVTVVAEDDEGDTATDNNDHAVSATDVAPVVSIVKDGPATINEGGDTATYDITITNDSVSTDPLTITSLMDDQFGDLLPEAETANGGPITLNPGDSFTFQITRDLTLNAGETHINVITVIGVDDEGTSATDDDDHTVTGENVTPVIDIVKDGPATINEGGDTATYDITITNDSVSTDPLTITSLMDDQFGNLLPEAETANGGPITLNPGDSFTFQITRSLTLNVGETHTNTVTVVGVDDEDTEATDNDNHTVDATDVTPLISIVKDGPATINEGGDSATYNITITNDSVSTDPLTITSLNDDQFGDLLPEAESARGGTIVLASGESFSFQITRSLEFNVGNLHTNVATVVGVDDEGTEATDDDDHTVAFANVAPAISITKDGPATINEGGDSATYDITITNDSVSTDPLTITSLTDDKFGDLLPEAEAARGGTIVLASGESFTFQITRSLEFNVGDLHTNVVTVVGVDDEGTEATDDDDHTVAFANVAPAISITKDGPATINEGGDNATYDITITNDSVPTDPLTITSLLDDQFGDLLPEAEAANGGPITLNPGESFSFSIDRDLTLDAGETHINVVTVVAEDDEGDTATDNDDHAVSATDVAPVVSIDKNGPTTINEGGDTATYDITITNDSVSTDPLTITSLLDDQFGNLLPEAEAANGGPITLAQGESFTFSFDRDLTLNVGETHTNVVTVVGIDDEGTEATDNDDHMVGATDVAPAITVTKTADQAQVFAPGENVTFTVVIENNSVSTDPVTIDSLTDSIHGDLNGQGDCSLPQTIQPGSSYTCSFTVLVDGDETDVITASGTDDDGTPVSDSDDATVDMINPAISIVKLTNGYDANDAPGPEILVSNTVTWEYIVSNDGDVALENISVVDDQSVAVSCPTDTLLVNQSMSCFANGISEVGQYANLGTVTATHTDVDGDTTNRTDDDPSHYFGATPSIAIDKQTADAYGNAGDAIGILPGETVTWNYYVTNDGNVVLVNVSVTDDQGVSVTCPQNTLAVGESMTCTASGIAGEDWYYNVGTASGDYSDDVGNSTSVTDSDGSSYYGLTPGTVTNSSLCDFGDQFRLLFTPDMGRYSSSTPYYKLSDSNPGQFFYNVFYVNDGSTDTIALEIPYPFVTQGANPVHVYGGLFVNPEGSGGINCFLPTNELAAYSSVFGLGDYTDTNGDGEIGFGDVYLVDVPAELGFQYINIHLDYGLEKTDGWLKKGANATSDGTGKNPAPADLSINDNTAHTFQAYADGVLIDGSTDTVYNLNEYKQIRGFGGLVQYEGNLDPVIGVEVQLFDPDGILIETMITDSDGWYLSDYQHRGKATTYTLVLVSTGEEIQTTVGGKDKFGEGNFLVPQP